MDESWRMRNGLNLPRRRSTEETSSDHIRRAVFAYNCSSDSQSLQPEDFNDVFGGPPRSLVYRKLSADFAVGDGPSSFYEDIFRSSEFGDTARRGRNLPVFRIPETLDVRERGEARGRASRRTEGFYVDIFGAEETDQNKWRSESKSRSKSTTSSVLSSEDRSPLCPSMPYDAFFSSFSSKLRPVNVPHRPNRSPSMPTGKQKMRGSPDFSWNHPHSREFQFAENDHYMYRSNHLLFPPSGSSPETISVEPNSYQSFKVSPEDQETESPSSVVSSLCQDPDSKAKFLDKALEKREVEQEHEQEVMSSYVIEINSDKREVRDESVAIDEAIAWAKEKFQGQTLEATKIVNQKEVNEKSSAAEPFEYGEDFVERSTLHQLSNGRENTSDLNFLWEVNDQGNGR